MRSEEMFELIMKKAHENDRIRAVVMCGSRANSNAVHDRYSDFDIVYFVTDVREFTKDKTWVEYDNICNEFRWLCVYISKGLCREELYYAKYMYDVLVMGMFMKMLN